MLNGMYNRVFYNTTVHLLGYRDCMYPRRCSRFVKLSSSERCHVSSDDKRSLPPGSVGAIYGGGGCFAFAARGLRGSLVGPLFGGANPFADPADLVDSVLAALIPLTPLMPLIPLSRLTGREGTFSWSFSVVSVSLDRKVSSVRLERDAVRECRDRLVRLEWLMRLGVRLRRPVVVSRDIGVGVGGCSFPHGTEACDDAVSTELGMTLMVDEAIFFLALACTHCTSCAYACLSDTGRVRGHERGAVRGAVPGVACRPPLSGVKRLAGGAECCRIGNCVVGDMSTGGPSPKKSAGGSHDHPTQRSHTAGGAATDIDIEKDVMPGEELKKWSNVTSEKSSSKSCMKDSASVPRSIGCGAI